MLVCIKTDPDLVDRDHEHALKHLREISEVECIVRLGRSRQQLSSDGVVYGSSGVDQLRNLSVPDIMQSVNQ